MATSGVYAGTTQITDGQLSTSGVDIKLSIYSLNEQNEEEPYDTGERIVMPSDTISFIPKIESLGASCYVRTKILYINNTIDASEYITGLSNQWEKKGDYYYFNRAIATGETVKLFDTIQIPYNIDEMNVGEQITLEVIAEAVQEKNFEPDYDEEDPWKGIVPTESVSTQYDIDTNDNNITISFKNGASQDIVISEEFITNLKNIMPGDTYTSSITLKNANKKNAKYYVTLLVDELSQKDLGLLSQITMKLTNSEGQVVYNGTLKDIDSVLFGKYDIGEEDTFDVEITIPDDLPNEFAGMSTSLNWVFSVDYEKDQNPNTGDKINVAITIFVISAIGLIAVMVLNYKENKNIDDSIN